MGLQTVVTQQRHASIHVVATQAKRDGYEVSLMERLMGAGLNVHLLRTQYRMHPALAEWPSDTFYQGQLLSSTTPADRQPPLGMSCLPHTVPL